MDWLRAYKDYLKEEKKFLKKQKKESKEFTLGTFFVLLLSILNLSIWGNYFLFKKEKISLNKKDIIEVDFLAIRGEAILIRYKNKNFLINTGSSNEIIDVLKDKKINSLEKVFITYPLKRNIGGTLHLLYTDFPVGEILFSEVSYNAPHYEEFLSLIREKSVSFKKLKLGDKIDIGEDFFIQVIGPIKEYEKEKNNSLVLRMVYKNFAVLFAGDIEKEGESDLSFYGTSIHSHILKIPNQAMASSFSPPFIDIVNPEVAVVIADVGNPDDDFIGLLKEWGIKVFRSDLQGEITVFTDGENFKVKTEL